jgi:hypothetical protein
MTHGFRIAGLALGLVVLGFGPAGAWGYKHSGTGSDIRSGTSTEGQDDSGTGVRGGAGAGLGGGVVVPSAPATGGTLGTDPSVHGPSDPVLKHPDQPSASPRMETEPGARDRMREREQWWPRSRVDEERSQPGVQSPRSDRSPSQPDQPLRSYKQ